MKLHLIVMFIVVIALAACTTKEETRPVLVVPDVAEPIVAEAPQAEEETQPAEEFQIDEQIQNIIELHKKITSYTYIDASTFNTYSIKGDKIKVVLKKFDGKFEDAYDTIYLDTQTKTAYATCMNNRICASKKKEYWSVSYNSYYPTLPESYLAEISTGKVIGSETCENMKCFIIEYQKDSKTYRMLVKDTYGLPFKISVKNSDGAFDPVIMFTDQAYDHLKDSDVTLGSLYVLRQ